MTTYNVYIFREMRLVFGPIEADTHEAADAIAEECGEWKWENLEPAFRLARDVIAEAEAAGIHPEPSAPNTAATEMYDTLRYVAEMLSGFKTDFLGPNPTFVLPAAK
jgi:hypothetical protein